MRYSYVGAREGRQRLLHSLLCRNIQMICRLVQHQEIGSRKHKLQECQPGLLAAGKLGNLTVNIVSPEQEGSQIPSRLLLIKTIFIKHLIQHSPLKMQTLMLLRKITYLNP